MKFVFIPIIFVIFLFQGSLIGGAATEKLKMEHPNEFSAQELRLLLNLKRTADSSKVARRIDEVIENLKVSVRLSQADYDFLAGLAQEYIDPDIKNAIHRLLARHL